MFRVWSEYLPLDVAASQDVITLLQQGELHPIFAIHHDADLDAASRLLEVMGAAGRSVGIWPLLDDEQGYWPCEQNAEAYFRRVKELLSHFDAARVLPAWLAIDLEPPIKQVESLRYRIEEMPELVRTLRGNLDARRFEESIARYTRELERLNQRYHGLSTLAVTLPMAAHDLIDDQPLWQDLLEAPWAGVPWDRAGIMAYGSMVAGYSRGFLSVADARAIHYRLFRHLHRALGHRAHASLGVTGRGKLGNETTYESPEELAADVSAARAAGVEDLAFFCMEGFLEQARPGEWVEAIRRAAPLAPPMTLKAQALRVGANTARTLLRRLST